MPREAPKIKIMIGQAAVSKRNHPILWFFFYTENSWFEKGYDKRGKTTIGWNWHKFYNNKVKRSVKQMIDRKIFTRA